MRSLKGWMIPITYLIVWSASLILYWTFFHYEGIVAFNFGFIWIILPAVTLVLSFLVGLKNIIWKWIWPFVFCLMYLLLMSLTVFLGQYLVTGNWNMPDLTTTIFILVISLTGFAIGQLICRIRGWRIRKTEV